MLRFFCHHQFVSIASHFFLCAPLVQHKCMCKALYPLFLQTHIKGVFLFFSPSGENSSGSEERDRTHAYIVCAFFVFFNCTLYVSIAAGLARVKKRVGTIFRQYRKMRFFAWLELVTTERELCMNCSMVKRLSCGC